MIQDNPAFRRWAGTDADILAGSEIDDHNWSLPGPHILEAFHGTTHEFQAFSLVRNTHEAQFGKVHYFTSCSWDAATNYATEEGPDLKNRIDHRSERLEQEIEDDPEAFDLDPEVDADAISVRAREIAQGELIGSTPEVKEVYLRLNKPFVIDATGQKDREVFDDPYSHSDAVAEVADNHGITPEEVEENFVTYEEEVYETLDEAWADTHEKISCGLMQTAISLGCAAPEMPQIEDMLLDITCNTFERSFKDSDGMMDLSDDEGTLVSGSFFAGLLEYLGFDSIVLLNADKRFKSMDMMPGTTHIHLMGSARAQIKSVQNHGNFDPENPDIYA
jgi:hypothetical protein